jgi:hypothetical protein
VNKWVVDVPSRKNLGKYPQNGSSRRRIHPGDIQQAVLHIRLWANLHPTAIATAISYRNKYS